MTLVPDTKVTVGVLTYKRPIDLKAILPLLLAQARRASAIVDILVVDNDPAGGAAEMVLGMADIRLRYVHEPTPGISAGRNRALDEAADSDFLVYIDDDERPSDNWLELLLETYLRENRPVGVVGPVVSRYEQEVDAWIKDGRFFERRRHDTGTEVMVAATNNLLLDLRQVQNSGIRFDERFSLTGGSDTLFTRQLVRSGGRLVWCDEAHVVDVVPASRLTREWVMQRAFRSANSWSRSSIALAHSPARLLGTRLQLTGKGIVRVVGGRLLDLCGAASRSQQYRARGQRAAARGAGMLKGAWGHVYAEYAR